MQIGARRVFTKVKQDAKKMNEIRKSSFSLPVTLLQSND